MTPKRAVGHKQPMNNGRFRAGHNRPVVVLSWGEVSVPIPFGLFGSLVFLLAAEVLLAGFFVFVWPAVNSRPLVVLGSGVALGAIASIALWIWFLSPLNSIGISGQRSIDGQSADRFAAYMMRRYALIVVAVAVAQIGVMAVLRLWTSAGRS